jgi:hypothetical protein
MDAPAQADTDAPPRPRLDDYLLPKAARDRRRVFRDRQGRLLLVDERAVDHARITRTAVSLIELGKRVRVYNADMSRQQAAYIIPAELLAHGSRDGAGGGGGEIPLGTVIHDHGLYLRLRPGLTEVGTNDRQDVILRDDPRGADRTVGPVLNSANTIIAGRAKRLVTRVSAEEHGRDVAEARAWLRALEIVHGRRTLVSRFVCAGIRYLQRGNSPYLQRTTQLNFFAATDPDMQRLAATLATRFRALGRRPPEVEILSLLDVPVNERAYRAFTQALRRKRRSPERLGLPRTLAASRFYDPETRSVPSANLVHFCPLKELGDRVTILTVNTDYHGEVKSRGVLSPLMAIMSLIGIISAHAGTAVLNRRGTATTFTGPTGTGKTTACTFWAEKNEKYRRQELRRRYELDLGREGAGDATAGAAAIMETTGILCQEDWVEIVPLEDGSWVFWPTERACYARTGGFPGLRFVLAENTPLLENAAADFGAAASWDKLGRVTHDYFPERLFYDPVWDQLVYDRTPRPVTANVFLERDPSLPFCVKRVAPQEAVEWLLKGRTPAGKYEPLYNAYPDFSGLLMSYGVVGDKLIAAYEAARHGAPEGLAAGDAEIGRALLDKLDVQVRLWLEHATAVATFIVNGAPGLEITQDINWYLSEYPAFLAPGDAMSTEAFKALMGERYGVTYSARGRWTHVTR